MSGSEMRRVLWAVRFPAILATIAIVATLLAGVTLTPATAGAGYQKPKIGQCRNISLAQSNAATNSTKPISCSSSHTAQTVAVGKLSAKVWKSKAKTNDAIASKCQKAWDKAVGRSKSVRLKSAFALKTFTPTKAQKKKGARWYRCDAVVLRGKSLTPLTTTKTPLLSSPTPANQARCLTSGSSRPTTCDATHSYKATATFKLRGKKFPGKKSVKSRAKNGCNSRVSTSSYKYDAPNKGKWNDGYKYVICFSAHTLPPASPKETVAPQTTLEVPSGSVSASTTVLVTGVATDNAGVGSLSATVRNAAGDYLQDDGTLAATVNPYPYENTAGALGTTSMSWEMDLTAALPADTYTVAIAVNDINGNGGSATDSFVVVGADTTKPTVTITGPASSITLGTAFNVNANATDSGLLKTLKLRIKKGSQFLQDNGTFGAGTNDLESATISALPAANATVSFNAGTTAFPVGTSYQVILSATDVAGNLKTATKNIAVTATPTFQAVTYLMNEPANSFTMADSGGNGLNGSIPNPAGLTTGVVFEGATGYQWAFRSPTALPPSPERVVSVPDNDLLDAGSDTFTVEIRYRTSNSFGNIIQKGQSGTTGGQWKIQAPGGQPSCLFKSSAGTTEQASVQSIADLSDNKWHILRCTLDANFVTMWIDPDPNIPGSGYVNRKAATNVGVINNNVALSIGGKLSCGMDATIECDYFSGHIDYVKLSHS